MTKIELENIISQINNLKNCPNSLIMNNLDLLSNEFEVTKNNIIQLTYHLDKIEELYDKTLNEYQSRGNE